MVRQPRLSEAAAIAEIHVKTWQIAYRDILPADFLAGLDTSRREVGWRRLLHREDGEPWVYVYDVSEGNKGKANVVGFVSGGPCRDPDATPVTAELMAIYLHPDWWGAGIGRELLSAGIDAARRGGFQKMTLWVLEENSRAIRFYEKAGFRLDPPPAGVKIEQIGGRMVKEVRYRLDLNQSAEEP